MKNEISCFYDPKNLDDLRLKFWEVSGAKGYKSCGSRKILRNENLVAKIGVETAENATPRRERALESYSEMGGVRMGVSGGHTCYEISCALIQRTGRRCSR